MKHTHASRNIHAAKVAKHDQKLGIAVRRRPTPALLSWNAARTTVFMLPGAFVYAVLVAGRIAEGFADALEDVYGRLGEDVDVVLVWRRRSKPGSAVGARSTAAASRSISGSWPHTPLLCFRR